MDESNFHIRPPSSRRGLRHLVVLLWCLSSVWLTGEAYAQADLPGDDPAAWLVEASVQARRVSGVGEELTLALQTKGALLDQIAFVQREIGEDDAAAANEQIVALCLRALSHDGDDGWILASRALQAWWSGRDGEIEGLIESITNPAEREYIGWYIQDEGGSVPEVRTELDPRFIQQIELLDNYVWARSTVSGIVRNGSIRDAQAWVAVLDDPAERAWASLGVAEGLLTRVADPPLVQTTTEPSKPLFEPEPAEAPEPASESESPPPIAIAEAAEEISEQVDTLDVTEAEVEIEAEAKSELDENDPQPLEAPAETPVAIQEKTSEDIVITSANDGPVATEDNPDATEIKKGLAETPLTDTAELNQATLPTESEPETELSEAAVEKEITPADTAALEPEAFTPPVVPNLKALADPARVLDDAPAEDVYELEFTTTKGPFTVRVHRKWAPLAADRFYDLAAAGFYQNQRLFRVVPGFVVQWGIHGFPDVAAAWRPETLPDEPRTQPNRRGTIAFAAATRPNTRTTQVFVNLDDNAFLDDLGFVPFGEVVDGMDVVESLFGGYGETPSTRQRDIQLKGNAFLDAEYPGLDSILSVKIVEE
ncbi:MAG: peptidylprolyl isomerase [Planctomycetota bacterium]